jgi:hypothetical protein
MGKAVEELIITYRTRRQIQTKLSNAITSPEVTDTFFEQETENAFNKAIDNILRIIHKQPLDATEQYDDYISDMQNDTSIPAELLPDSGLSIISIEIDGQAALASRYGDQFARNLVKVISTNLKPGLLRIFADSVKYNFYYLCAGRYYLIIPNFPLDEARKNAERIRRRLLDNYEVSIVAPMNNETKSTDLDSKQLVPLSVHIGVSFYAYKKLEDLLGRYSFKTAIGKVRALINLDIEKSLDKGRLEKGNVVISWNPSDDPRERTYKRWPPGG